MPLNETVGSGYWSDSNIWSLGRTPQSGDDVRINDNHTVTVDVTDIEVLSLCVRGRLYFPVDFPAGGLGFHLTVTQNPSSPSTGFIDFQQIQSPSGKHLPFVFLKCSNEEWDLSALTGFFDNFYDVFPLTKHGYWSSLSPQKGGWFGIVVSVNVENGVTTLTVSLPSDVVTDNYFSAVAQLSNGTIPFPVCISPPTTFKNATISQSGTNFTVTVNEEITGIEVGSVVFPLPFIPVVLNRVKVEPRPDGLYQIDGECSLTSHHVWSVSVWNSKFTNPLIKGNLLFLFGRNENSWEFERGVVSVSVGSGDPYRVLSLRECWVGGTELPTGTVNCDRLSSLSDLEINIRNTKVQVGKWEGKVKLLSPPPGTILSLNGELNPQSTLSPNTSFVIGNSNDTSTVSSLSFSQFFSQHSQVNSEGTIVVVNGNFSNDLVEFVSMTSNSYLRRGGTVTVEGEDFPEAECFVKSNSVGKFVIPTTKPFFGVGTNQQSEGLMFLVGKGVSVVRWSDELNWYWVETDGKVEIIVPNETNNDLTLPLINPKEFGVNEVPPWGIETSDPNSSLIGLFVGGKCNGEGNPFVIVSSSYPVVATRGKSVGSETSVTVVSQDNITLVTKSFGTTEYSWFGYLNPKGDEKILLPKQGKTLLDVHSLTVNYYPNYERMRNLFSMEGFDGVEPDFSVLPSEGYIVYVVGSLTSLAFAANFISIQQNQLTNEGITLTPRLSPKVHLPRFISTFLRELVPPYPYKVVILPDENKVYIQIFCVTSEPTLSEMNTISTGIKRLFSLLNKVHPPSTNWTVQYFVVHRFP